MTKREKLVAKIEANIKKINKLQELNIELKKESVLLSDDKQWFTEEKEIVQVREGKRLVKVEKLIGRVHWKQDIKDDDTDKVITIERCRVVRIDGSWDW